MSIIAIYVAFIYTQAAKNEYFFCGLHFMIIC